MNKSKKEILKWLVLPVLALVVFGITRLFITYPYLAERYYSQTLYPVLATGISAISSLVPFSIDDAFYIALILTGIVLLIFTLIGKISLLQSLLTAINVLASVYILFYFLWGFNYFRVDINNRLELLEHKANPEEFINVFRTIIEDANASYTTFDDIRTEEVAGYIEESYERLAPAIKIHYPGGFRRAKRITFSGLFAQAGISGYFGPFFNEVHINSRLLPLEYPFVLAHEKAHQFGVTGEAEANFFAWLVCSQSTSKHLQYSAHLIALRYFMVYGRNLEDYRDVISKIDQRIIEDIRRLHLHWQELRNDKVESVAERMNDAYLKTNQVEKGIKDYTGIVKHIMDFSLDTEFRKNTGL